MHGEVCGTLGQLGVLWRYSRSVWGQQQFDRNGSFGDSANLMGHHRSKGASHDSMRYVFAFCSSVVEVDFFFSLIWSGWRGDCAL